MKPFPTPPLDRQQITAKALELLKAGGLKNISTRRLGEELGIKSASLYHHFRNKQDLLDHVTTAMLAPVWRAPDEGERWQDWLIATARRLRRQLQSYPDSGLVAVGSTPTSDHAATEAITTLFKPLLAAGFPHAQARFVLFAVLRFTGGWVSDEQAAATRGDPRPESVAEEGFEFGVRAIVTGCEVELRALSEAAEGSTEGRGP